MVAGSGKYHRSKAPPRDPEESPLHMWRKAEAIRLGQLGQSSPLRTPSKPQRSGNSERQPTSVQTRSRFTTAGAGSSTLDSAGLDAVDELDEVYTVPNNEDQLFPPLDGSSLDDERLASITPIQRRDRPPRFLAEVDLESAGISQHKKKRTKQALNWKELLIILVELDMEFMRTTKKYRDYPDIAENIGCTNCVINVHKWKVTLVGFNETHTVTVSTCAAHPSVSLPLHSLGYFPCSPCRPTMAIDMRVLDFVSRLFVQVSPNHTAWSAVMEDICSDKGSPLGPPGTLRKRFTTALTYYQQMKHKIRVKVTAQLDESRRVLYGEQPVYHHGLVDGVACAVSEENAHTEDDTDNTEFNNTSRKRKCAPPPPPPPPVDPLPPPPDRERYSDYLRERCPMCFGEYVPSTGDVRDTYFVFDAVFTQKHREGLMDPILEHHRDLFLEESYLDSYEHFTDACRSSAKKGKRSKSDMPMRSHIYDECNDSFTAADERRLKGTTTGYDSTGLFGMLCRHDRPLWLANMKSAGEKQFYVIALLRKGLQEIPRSAKVGVLYDIGCQLHRSVQTYPLLDPFRDRILFGVSVFHAYGHQWACQLCYHPRKIPGFGHTCGEGCEPVWSFLELDIAFNRVCGYHRRLFTLNCRLDHLVSILDSRIGQQMLTSLRRVHERRNEAEDTLKDLKTIGYTVQMLREQLKSQVETQTKAPPRQGKNAGKTAVENIFTQQQQLKTVEDRISDLSDIVLSDAHLGEAVEAAQERLVAAKKKKAELVRNIDEQQKALGIKDMKQLKKLQGSTFLQVLMNLRILLFQIRAEVQARKFEIERVERAGHGQKHHSSKQQLRSHTNDAIKKRGPKTVRKIDQYNNLIKKLEGLARREPSLKRLVPNAIDPTSIFQLEVDSQLWEDLHVDMDSEPPSWLYDKHVRRGILAVQTLDRAREEEQLLRKERRSLQTWFSEEWKTLEHATKAADVDLRYQLKQRRRHLLRMYALWIPKLREFGEDTTLPAWGPTDEELDPSRYEIAMTSEQADADSGGCDAVFEDDIFAEPYDAIDSAELLVD